MRHAFALLILVAGISFSPQHAQAQWQPDGAAISTATNNQYNPAVISDGAGGAIVTWVDDRSGVVDVYAQRVNASGVSQWTSDGVALCIATGNQYDPTIVADGAGGAIVTWEDGRSGTNSDIYVQHVDAAGIPQWTADGVALCTAANDVSFFISRPTIAPDGAGGAIVTWTDFRSGLYTSDIYAQRVNALGVPQWTTDGVGLCTAAEGQAFPTIISDGTGGVIVTWQDFRSGINSDIYVQRVDAAGVPQWTTDGVALRTLLGDAYNPQIVSDGAAGAIVTWAEFRSGSGGFTNIYARRVNAAGVPQWTLNGVVISNAANDQYSPTIVSDDAGGAIVTWQDKRNGTNYDIYAQRVNASGTRQWAGSGVALCTAAVNQIEPKIAPDGAGGAIVTWVDERSDTIPDIYAQRVSSLGVASWTFNGLAVCTAANDQRDAEIVSDGAGGAIVTWGDFRSFTSSDVYAQHVPDLPNAVAIVSFDATESDGVVTLRSAFRSDLRVNAVNVYRGVGSDDDPMRIIERADGARSDHFDYVDRDVAPGQTYRYQIGVVDADGEFFSPIVTVSVNAIAGDLQQNKPNPFNPTTTIRFVLPTREDVTLAIYDTNGRLVRTLLNEARGYGAHEVTWDGRDDSGSAVGSGVYFYRLEAGKVTESKKMVLLK